MSDNFIQLPQPTGVLTSLNGETGAVTLQAGSNISITPLGQNITISATGISPGGVNQNIQFNNSGMFGGSASLFWDGSTLTSLGNITAQSLGTFGELSSDNAAFTTDGSGGVTMAYFTSDGGTLYSDGAGNLHTVNISASSISCSGFRISTITPGVYPFTIPQNTSNAVALIDTSSARTINLPLPTIGLAITIKDSTGTGATNAITIARHASEKIEGIAASYIFQQNWGSLTLISNGTDWFII